MNEVEKNIGLLLINACTLLLKLKKRNRKRKLLKENADVPKQQKEIFDKSQQKENVDNSVVEPPLKRRNTGIFEQLKMSENLDILENVLHMSGDEWSTLLAIVGPAISKKQKMSIPVELCLAITLRFLATGEQPIALKQSFKISTKSILTILGDTVSVVYNSLKDKYLNIPQTKQEWKAVSNRYYEKYDVPLCIGVTDSKLIAIDLNEARASKPNKNNNLILLAIVDADYKFLYVEVTYKRHTFDGGVWKHSIIERSIQENVLNIPGEKNFPTSTLKSPYYFIGEEGFPLKTYLMKPYVSNKADYGFDEKAYNYRIGRCKKTINNAFGILGKRFQILNNSLFYSNSKLMAKDIILAACVLHNFLQTNTSKDNIYNDESTDFVEYIPKHWTTVTSMVGKPSNEAKLTRDNLSYYFNNTHILPNQYEHD